MTESIMIASLASGVALPDNSTRFLQAAGSLSIRINEIESQVPVRDAGTASNMFIRVNQNDVASATSCVITLRTSGAGNTTLTVSYGTSQTGIKEDTAHAPSVLATDTISIGCVTTSVAGNHTVTVTLIGWSLTPTTVTNTVTVLANSGANGAPASVDTEYWCPSGVITAISATEANKKYRVRVPATARNLFVYVSANARTGTVTYKSRLNGGVGGQSVQYLTTQTGQKEDSSNSDTLAAGDDYDYSVVFSADANAITHYVISSSFVTTNGYFPFIAGPTNLSVNSATTANVPVGGILTSTTTEADVQFYPEIFVIVDLLQFSINTNTLNTGTHTLKIRASATTGNGNGSISFTTETGLVTADTTNSDVLTPATTFINYQIITAGASGAVSINWIACMARKAPPYPSFQNSYNLANVNSATINRIHNTRPVWVNY